MKRDYTWLEYMENELPAREALQMEMLLVHSAMDRRILKNLEAVKTAAQQADSVVLPTEPAYFDNLHDKIMARIEQTEVEKAPAHQPLSQTLTRRLIPARVKSWLSLATSFYIITITLK